MELLKAIEITEQTLIGVYGKPPHDRGNCFSVRTECGQHFKIVNFVHENLVEQTSSMGLDWPVQIGVLSDRIAVIHDHRIPNDWYPDRFCEACCPKDLLTITQRLRIERDIASGRRVERDGFVMVKSERHR